MLKNIIIKVKGLFFKDGLDLKRKDLNLYNFHPQLRICLLFAGVFFKNSESKFRWTWPIFCVLVSSVGIALEFMFIVHGVQVEDYAFATECFCHWIIVTVVPIVHFSSVRHRKIIMQLVYAMNEDFLQVCSISPQHREIFMKGQLLIWMLYLGWSTFTITIPIFFAFQPISIVLWQTTFATQTEHTQRPLIFPMWLPYDDPYRSPNYECMMLLELFSMLVILSTFGVYVYVLFHLMLHYYTIMNVMILDIENIFEGIQEQVAKLPSTDPRRIEAQLIFNRRIKRIVCWHIRVLESVQYVAMVYGPPLVYQIAIGSPLICVTAYQVADGIDHGKLNFLFAELFCAVVLQAWIPCYLGTIIRNKGFDVADACWSCGWSETALGTLIRKDLIIIMKRAQIPLHIKFFGLPNLQLETFSSIMSSAYSYFNMIRQSANKGS